MANITPIGIDDSTGRLRPFSGGDSLVGGGGSAGFEFPRWVKATRTYAQLAAAATTNDVEVYSLPAGGVIHAVKIKHSVAFSGGSISAYTVSVGITGNLTKYASAFNVFQAVADTTFQLSSSFGSEDHGAATSIRLAATATGDDLDQATQGSVDVWILVSEAV